MRRVVDALVLRVVDSGEHDRLLLVLTADEGKLWITAKGARSVRSKYASLCRIFAYANFEFYEKNGRAWLSGGSLNNGFFDICADLCDFSLASYIMQLADEITGEALAADEILRTTLNTLYTIEKKLYPREQIKAVYELFAARASGFEADLCGCEECKKTNFEDNDGVWLDVMNGALICGECQKKRSGGLPMPQADRFATKNLLLPLNTSALSAMRYVFSAELKRIFSFSLSDPGSASLFSRAAEGYLLNHLERDFEALKFFHSVNSTEQKERK